MLTLLRTMINLQFIAFSLAVVSSVLGGRITTDLRIMGGEPTTINEYPCAVHIERLNEATQVWGGSCGASILTPRWLLSAAHCFEESNFTPTNRRIRAGSSFRGSGGTVVNIESRVNHPDYFGVNPDGTYDSIDNDISVVYLQELLVFSDVIQPCSIISQGSTLPPDNVPVVQVGWGRLEYNGDVPEQILKVTTYVVNQQECARRYNNYNELSEGFNTTITDNMICNGILDVGGQGPCSGDSGGPMFFYGVNVAIVSWGYECGDSYYPAVSARIAPFANWVVSIVG